jgi:hypothetical protein
MKWTIDHSCLPAYLRVTIEGDPTAESNFALWDELLLHDSWTPGRSVMFNVTALQEMGPAANEITQLAIQYFIENEKRIGPSCIAVVRGERGANSYSRQFQYALRLRGSSVVIRYFADEDAAAEWLMHISRTDVNGTHSEIDPARQIDPGSP